ncbi:serine/threonine-protein kinase Sgk2 [Xylaria curta]|nr:serine/threonine-protein kinase Sgk2 [Xylaria curta]
MEKADGSPCVEYEVGCHAVLYNKVAFTDEQIKIISEYPLDDALGHFRSRVSVHNPNVLHLLVSLRSCRAAHLLYYPDNRKVVDSLQSIGSLIHKRIDQDEETNLHLFNDLVDHVIAQPPTDSNIWAAVFRLIDTYVVPARPVTPVTPSSLPQLLDSANRRVVEETVFQEVRECTFRDVGGFFEKFFNVKKWRGKKAMMFQGMMTEYNKRQKKWKGFPEGPEETPVWKWLCRLEERHLQGAINDLHTTTHSNQLEGPKSQLDFFLQKANKKEKAIATDKFSYKDILVIGEHERAYDPGKFKLNFLQLTRYVRRIFADQPTRRFVHAFSFLKSTMELWVFDRSGPYSSGPFDINEHPEKFASALVGYAMYDSEKMGLDTFIKRNNIQIDNTKFKLQELLVSQKAIVCRGTTCYRTKSATDGTTDGVVKFSWGPTKRTLEVMHLELAANKGVKGVAKLVAYHEVTTIAKIREGLTFTGRRYKFRENDSSAAMASTNTSGSKRKSTADHTSSRSKRQQTSVRQKSKLANQINDQPVTSENKNSDLWENRSCSCLVIQPAGRIISDFQSLKELLGALHDAIQAHRSLLLVGGILHRDISPNNIIITDPAETEGKFRGMLIDLDLAKMDNDTTRSGAEQRTGTIQFMAIQVLQGVDHTYRHDLESFFYVLLWMCAHQSWENKLNNPEETQVGVNMLQQWGGSFANAVSVKSGHMSNLSIFQQILDNFPEAMEPVKKLCFEIREILFPGGYGFLVTDTPARDPDELYTPILKAYEDAIENLDE